MAIFILFSDATYIKIQKSFSVNSSEANIRISLEK